MRSLFRRGIHFLLIALAAFVLSIQASADTVNLGTDYLQTLPGTFFNFTLPGLGTVPVPFMGNPIGPGNTDSDWPTPPSHPEAPATPSPSSW